ncbi:MAG: nucleotidyltransferase domain-containing protein [Candidatus Bathyarchaeota archaeon]|nr:nucleotidyltransferase domain-containing protein [Candidatus Bathyarchaeota archaeon]
MSREGWARYALERYLKLRSWMDYRGIIVKACRDILGDRCLSVYVVGGAAEDRLTVLSDIDVVVVVDDPSYKSLENMLAVKRRAEELGLPVDVWLDVKISTEEEFKQLIDKGVYRKVIEVS